MAFRTADILDCFSTAYETARQAFVSTAQSHGARVSSHLNPVGEGASGELLYMDIAELGDARGESSLIISSGTHGIEGYAGSALQIGLLRDGLTEILPHGTVCYLVHAVNPFGFSYKRRVNEDNVDLNRNFIDFSHSLPNSEDFRAFRDFADGKIAAGRVADEIDAGELYLQQAGRRSGSTRRATIQRMMNCFCPDDPGWRADVWQQFRQRMNETVEFLKHR